MEYATMLNLTPFSIAWAPGGFGGPGKAEAITRLPSPPPLEGTARGMLMNKVKKTANYM